MQVPAKHPFICPQLLDFYAVAFRAHTEPPPVTVMGSCLGSHVYLFFRLGVLAWFLGLLVENDLSLFFWSSLLLLSFGPLHVLTLVLRLLSTMWTTGITKDAI